MKPGTVLLHGISLAILRDADLFCLGQNPKMVTVSCTAGLSLHA